MIETTNIPTGSPNDSPLTPIRFLQRSADVFPHKDAIIYSARRYTYREFAQSSEELPHAIRSRIAPGDRVIFLAPNIPEILIAHNAVPLAGWVLVALNSRLAGPQVHYVLEHCAATLLFIDAELVSGVGDAFWHSLHLRA